MRKEGLPTAAVLTDHALMSITADLHQPDISALYAAVGEGRISAQTIVQATGGGGRWCRGGCR